MTVVTVPIRLRVDALALDERLADVEDTFVAAVGRALAAADTEVVAPRGGPRRPRLDDPAFAWSGPALGGVTGPAREQIEARLVALLRELTTVAFDPDRVAGADGPGLLDRPQREPLDPTRHNAVVGVYLVPGYQDAGAPVAVDVANHDVEVDPTPPLRAAWVTFTTDDEVFDALTAVLAASGVEPRTATVGTILRAGDGRVWVGIADVGNRVWIRIDPLLGLERFQVVSTPRGPRLQAVPADLPASARYRLRPLGAATTPAQRVAILEEHFGDEWRTRLRAAAAQVALPVSADELDELIERVVHQMATVRAEHYGREGVRSFEVLEVDGQAWLLGNGAEIHDLVDVELIPLTEQVVALGQRGSGDTRAGGDALARQRTLDVLDLAATPGGAGPRCEPIEGEPAFEDLGPAGERLRRELTELAATLRTGICEHPGSTCRRLAHAIAARAHQIAQVGVREQAATRASQAGAGTLGLLDATAVASPAVLGLRELARAAARLDALANDVAQVVGDHAHLLPRPYTGRAASWQLRLWIALRPYLNDAVGWVFMAGCRTIMLQVLRASHQAIRDRLDNFTTYAALAEHAISALVTDLDHLEALQRELARDAGGTLSSVGQGVVDTWRGARERVVDALSGEMPGARYDRGTPGAIDRDATGRAVAIHDRNGRRWAPDELASAVEIARGTATSIDPVLQQLTDGHKARFQRDPSRIGEVLRSLLREMLAANEEVTRDCEADARYAFRSGSFTEADLRRQQATVPGSRVLLSGIHLQVHTEIGSFFGGSSVYGTGIDRLFGVELGKRSLNNFFEFTGLILLAVLCPPAAVVAGAGVSLVHRAEAGAAMTRSLAALDPNAFRERAEVEIELFAAELGLALSFLPVGGAVARGGAVAVRSAASRHGAQLFVRWARGAVTASMRASLRHGVAVALVRELATDQVMDLVLGRLVLGPAVAELQREFGPARVAAALGSPDASAGRRDPASGGEVAP